jgi:hypothetical protein
VIITEPIHDSFHMKCFENTVKINNFKRTSPHYLFHALVVPVEGNGHSWVYGLDDKITPAQFEELKTELKLMHFTGVSWHRNGIVQRIEF